MDDSAAFSATYDADQGEPQRLVIYVSCWTVHVGADAVGRFTLVMPEGAFADELAVLHEIVDTIQI